MTGRLKASRLGNLVLIANAVPISSHNLMTSAVDGFSHAVKALCSRATAAGDRAEFHDNVFACSV